MLRDDWDSACNRIAELEAALARWQFIGTHDYTERKPKYLGGGPGAVRRPTWEIDGLSGAFDHARAEKGAAMKAR